LPSTVEIVMVKSLVGEMPFNSVPGITIVSLAVNPLPPDATKTFV